MLRLAADWFVFSLLRFPQDALWAEALAFFLYDSIKILVLLFSMIAVIGFLGTYLPQAKVRSWLAERKSAGNFFAALFGAVTTLGIIFTGYLFNFLQTVLI